MATKSSRKNLSSAEKNEQLAILQDRFESNPQRHPKLGWSEVASRLKDAPGKLWSIRQMEQTGGEPDVIGGDGAGSGMLVMDCSSESPAGRRSLCYDRQGLLSRKDNPPASSAIDVATAMGIELLDEELYRQLQAVGCFDSKTSSWLLTPPELRALGGALFGDYRYGRVFVYHNGAQSWFGARGFRGYLRI